MFGNSKGLWYMIKVLIEALDGKPITPRTKTYKETANVSESPTERGYSFFWYVDPVGDSPGVAIGTDDFSVYLDENGNEIWLFTNVEKRKFKCTVLNEEIPDEVIQ